MSVAGKAAAEEMSDDRVIVVLPGIATAEFMVPAPIMPVACDALRIGSAGEPIDGTDGMDKHCPQFR